jgi:hypothetical protein
VFYDLSPGGTACKLLAAALKCKHDKNLRRFDFHASKPDAVERNVELLKEIEQELLAQDVLYVRAVFIAPGVDEAQRAEVADAVEKLQGYVAGSPEEATHVVHPTTVVASGNKGDGEPRAIPAFRRGKGAFSLSLFFFFLFFFFFSLHRDSSELKRR